MWRASRGLQQKNKSAIQLKCIHQSAASCGETVQKWRTEKKGSLECKACLTRRAVCPMHKMQADTQKGSWESSVKRELVRVTGSSISMYSSFLEQHIFTMHVKMDF